MRKKSILFLGFGNKKWIGGLYYTRNMLYSITNNKDITNQYNIIILTEQENLDIFEIFRSCAKIIIYEEKNIIHKVFNKFIGKAFDKELDLQINRIVRKYCVSYIYYKTDSKDYLFNNAKCIRWIPDFQDRYLKNMFSEKELKKREACVKRILKKDSTVVLSSKTALGDFRKFYCKDKKNIYVVPFVSFINDELETMSEEYEQQVLQKYSLSSKQYIYVPNQFWRHKNHAVVLKAISILYKRQQIREVPFVFTGSVTDYRNKGYTTQLEKFIHLNNIQNSVKILGFISRKDQLVIVKHAKFIIQPSLFEGWGTVLEDAKIFDKTVVLSNIEIHREQRYEKCIMFNPYSYKRLANIIYRLYYGNDLADDFEYGQKRLRLDSMCYGNLFFKAL